MCHLKNSHVGAVRCGGQVAATRHRVVRRLQIQLASQDTLVVQLLLTNASTKRRVQLRADYILQLSYKVLCAEQRRATIVRDSAEN